MRRIGILQASCAAMLALSAIATTTALAAAPSLFLLEGRERINDGHPASIVFQVNVHGPTCVQRVSDGTVTATGKPTAKLSFPGEEIEQECNEDAAISGFITAVELTSKGQFTVRSKGGIVVDEPVGHGRCAYEGHTFKGSFLLPSTGFEDEGATSPGKLNTKLSSPGCPTGEAMDAMATLWGPVGDIEAET